MAYVLGIDIGGTGIKAAPVDVAAGKLTAERFKLATPHPPTPDAVAKVVAEVASHFSWTGLAGITFPGVVTSGTIRTAYNLDPSWVGVNSIEFFGKATGLEVAVINDADAAGMAEMRFGAGLAKKGTVLLLTLGTGIGSALFHDGVLVPNTEFGHIEIHGHDAEKRASEHARETGDLSWSKWAGRVDAYLDKMEELLSPDLIIVGGGVSKQSEKFLPRLTLRVPIVPAALHNDAGIVGAAMTAAQAHA
ncbi:MAG TPA: ROK family protein [Streptosporangiaceae bacterium]|nr:ROK family protein [Streptosporangiaceae bacterium]